MVSLPLISEFTTNAADQVAFFDDIQAAINELCAIRPITISKATPPQQSDFSTAWLADDVSNTLPIPITQEFIWFDTTNNEVGGIYRTIDDEITNITSFESYSQNPSWSVNNQIAYDSVTSDFASSGNRSLYISDLMGYVTALTPGSGSRENPAWNPAGTALAFATTEYAATFEIAKINADGTGLTRLITNAVNDRDPHWRGTNIVFASDEFTSPSYQIFSMTDSGGSRTRLTSNAFNERHPQYSPDGTKIVYLSNRSGDFQVWIMNANGSSQTQLSSVGGGLTLGRHDPSYSPDGVWVYFGHYRIHPDGSGFETWYEYPTYIRDSQRVQEGHTWMYRSQPIQALSAAGATAVAISPNNDVVAAGMNYTGFYSITLIAIGMDDITSTGKIYQVSQFVDPAGNVRLLKHDIQNGTLASTVLEDVDLPDDIEHLLILIDGQTTIAGANANALMRFNGDSDAANYVSIRHQGQHNVLSRTENLASSQQGIPLQVPGFISGISQFSYVIWIPNIRGSQRKQAIIEGYLALSTIGTTTNHFAFQQIGWWLPTTAIQSISITTPAALGNFANNSRISYYGFPGKARWDR